MKKTLISLCAMLALAACSDHTQPVQAAPQYQQAQQGATVAPTAQGPIVVNNAPAQGGSGDMVRDMLLGGMIGHMIGGMGGGSRAPVIERHTTITRNVTVNQPAATPRPAAVPTPRPSPSYSSTYNASRPTVSRPSYSPSRTSSFGGRRR
jgi:predicted lipid-binding transport protein (Tim44 family)